ncbi:MAG TPA: hypothetical protein PKV17_14775, partial [Aquabacterium sp.]|nr:hypothetical protein [Aquabacterium sp.]
YRLLMERLRPHMDSSMCVLAPGASAGLLTALEYFGGHSVDGRRRDPQTLAHDTSCKILVLALGPRQDIPTVQGWQFVARERQRTQNSESVAVFRRQP